MRIDGYKKGKPDVAWWRRQINAGIAYRKKYASQARWDDWRKYYRGNWPANVLPVNLFFRMLRTTVPRLYFRNPSISCVATKTGMEQQIFAQLIERLDNKLIRMMGVKNQMKKMVQHTWMFGTSGGKLGYGAQFTPTPDEFDTAAPNLGGIKLQRKVEYNSLVQPNMPWFMAVHPGNLIVPDGLQNFEETPWVAMAIQRSVDDVKSDPRLDTAGLIGASGTPKSGDPGPTAVGKRASLDISPPMTLYEIRDMRTGKVIVISAYMCDDVLLFEDDALQNNNRPNIYPLQFNPDDEIFWGVPDSIILEPQQLEINEVRTLMMRHRRISLLKLFYKDKAIDVGELEKALNGDVLAAIRINKDADITDVQPMEIGHIPESLLMMDQTIEADARDSSGFSRNQSGEYASNKSHNAPTAFEAQIVAAAAEIRIDERKDAIADVLVQMFEDCNALIFNEWQDDQVVQVMGPDSMPYWVSFKPAMLKAARYEANIDPDSTVPETRDMRRQVSDKMYAALKTNPLIDPNLLTKYYLREQGGVALDQLMVQLQQRAAAGVPGSSPDQPMGPEQLMSMMTQKGGMPPPGSGQPT